MEWLYWLVPLLHYNFLATLLNIILLLYLCLFSAWDIYSIIKKIKGCKKVRGESSKSVREIREAENESRQLYVDLYKYKYESLHQVRSRTQRIMIH